MSIYPIKLNEAINIEKLIQIINNFDKNILITFNSLRLVIYNINIDVPNNIHEIINILTETLQNLLNNKNYVISYCNLHNGTGIILHKKIDLKIIF